jgi:hypothetical protein
LLLPAPAGAQCGDIDAYILDETAASRIPYTSIGKSTGVKTFVDDKAILSALSTRKAVDLLIEQATKRSLDQASICFERPADTFLRFAGFIGDGHTDKQKPKNGQKRCQERYPFHTRHLQFCVASSAKSMLP